MAHRPEHAPGDAAPATGIYEQLTVMGSSTGIRVDVAHGHPMPSAPPRKPHDETTWQIARAVCAGVLHPLTTYLHNHLSGIGWQR
jgi:hypothetical protein